MLLNFPTRSLTHFWTCKVNIFEISFRMWKYELKWQVAWITCLEIFATSCYVKMASKGFRKIYFLPLSQMVYSLSVFCSVVCLIGRLFVREKSNISIRRLTIHFFASSGVSPWFSHRLRKLFITGINILDYTITAYCDLSLVWCQMVKCICIIFK